MPLSFNSAQCGGIINITTYCEACMWPYVHIQRWWGWSKQVGGPAETALKWHSLAGVLPLTPVPLPWECVGPAHPARHPEPASSPLPMQQRWSGLLGSASGGSEESWEPGESGSHYRYTMLWTQSEWCFFKHNARFPAQTLEALHFIWWKSEVSPSEKGSERMLKGVVCHQAFEDLLWAELSCWFPGYDVSPAPAISSLLILKFAKLCLCLTLQGIEKDTAHCWTTLVSLWIDGHLSHHLTSFYSHFIFSKQFFLDWQSLKWAIMSSQYSLSDLEKPSPWENLFLSSQTQFRDAASAPCPWPWSLGPGSCCDHLAALGTCLQAGLSKLKIFLVFLGINSLNSTRKPHLVL